jgi:hypothetical protein
MATDDMQITAIINGYKLRLKSSISSEAFKKIIIELDNINNDNLSEHDDDLICDIYNSLNKKFSEYINGLLEDTTELNSGQTFGQLMNFIKHIGV